MWEIIIIRNQNVKEINKRLNWNSKFMNFKLKFYNDIKFEPIVTAEYQLLQFLLFKSFQVFLYKHFC